MPIKVTMPALSPTMTEGNLAKWLKSEGDAVEAGDVIAEIETDKATMEVEAVDEGVLGKIIIAEGTENVPVNNVIAVLLEDGESTDDIDGFLSSDNSTPQNEKKSGHSEQSEESKVGTPKDSSVTASPQNDKKSVKSDRVFASPLARRIAADKGLDLSSVKGSGPRSRIVKADVENAKPGAQKAGVGKSAEAIDAGKQANAFGMAYTEIPNNNIKKITAKRLTESKQTIPHFYLTIECELDGLLAARKVINEKANGEYKLSVNDFIVKAAAMALKAYPEANVSWSDGAVLQYEKADVSVAVATPNGLMTPIVKAAENKGLREISAEVKDLAGRAKDGKLKPTEFQGGSFTVSNLGMFGIKNFSAIINPPQSCILAVGAGVQKPVVIGGQVEIRTVMECTLSVDHRSVDGAVGAAYLQYFKKFVENPVSMLV